MVEPQIVVLVVAGSSPVDHPRLNSTAWLSNLNSLDHDVGGDGMTAAKSSSQ